jgi:hypothetical protein
MSGTTQNGEMDIAQEGPNGSAMIESIDVIAFRMDD